MQCPLFNYSKRLVFCLVLSIVPVYSALAQSFRSAQMTEVSRSGRSFALNLGSFNGLDKGMLAEFLVKTSASPHDGLRPIQQRLGTAELVKIMPERSYWYFRQVRQDVSYQAGDSVEFALVDDISRGIRPYQGQRRLAVLDQGVHPHPYARSQMDSPSIPWGPNRESPDYILDDEVFINIPQSDSDFEITTYDNWYVSRNKSYLHEYRQEMLRLHPVSGLDHQGKHQREHFKDSYRKAAQHYFDQAYSSIVEAYKFQGSREQIAREESLYSLHDRAQGPGLLHTMTVDNAFRRYQNQRQADAQVSLHAKQRIQKGGPLWSADMSESELREFFIQSGLAEERRIQERAFSHVYSNELTFEFGTGVNRTYTTNDPDFQGINYSLGLFYEFHLGRSYQALNRWGLFMGLERSVGFFDIGGFNAVYQEGHFSIGLNYYLHNQPSTLRDYIVYAGAGVKRGNGELRSAQLFEDYDTQSLSYPLHLGVKYRFSSKDELSNQIIGWGVNFRLSYEFGTKNILGFSDEEFNQTIEPDSINMVLGLSAYF